MIDVVALVTIVVVDSGEFTTLGVVLEKVLLLIELVVLLALEILVDCILEADKSVSSCAFERQVVAPLASRTQS